MRRLLVLCLALVGCGGRATEPLARVPRVGVYAYESAMAGRGTLTLTFATPDSIAGVWAVQGAEPVDGEMRGLATLGRWRGDAYELAGELTFDRVFGVRRTLLHRLTRQGETLRCTVRSTTDTREQLCTLTFRP